VDPEAEWAVRGAEFVSKAKFTPFEGWRARGRVRATLVCGRAAYWDAEMKEKLGALGISEARPK